MKTRRQAMATTATLLLGLSAGCTKIVFNERAEYDAAEPAVSESGLSETGYQHAGTERQTIEESVSAAGVDRTVVATNWIATYEKSLELQGQEQPAARFAVVSTPAIEILGRSFNPVDEMSHEELLSEFRSQLSGEYEQLDDIRYVESRDEVILEDEVEVSTFSTTATIDGEDVELYIHVATVTHEGDLIVAVGAHPSALAQERANTYTLMRSIEHDGDD